MPLWASMKLESEVELRLELRYSSIRCGHQKCNWQIEKLCYTPLIFFDWSYLLWHFTSIFFLGLRFHLVLWIHDYVPDCLFRYIWSLRFCFYSLCIEYLPFIMNSKFTDFDVAKKPNSTNVFIHYIVKQPSRENKLCSMEEKCFPVM